MIHIVGDVCFSDGYFDSGFGVGSQISKGHNPFQHINFQSGDLWLGNMECVLSTQSNRYGIHRKQFRTDPSLLSGLHHLDIYSVANNHVMQHGIEAYAKMLNYIHESGSKYVGDLHTKSLIIPHQGYNIGILAFSQHDEKFIKPPAYWYQPELNEVASEYSKIAECEIRIAYIHWGCEFIDFPYIDQQQFAHWLIDTGFNLVVGVHPHVLQGYEKYKDGYIFYSLGNFLFNMPTQETRNSAVLHTEYHQDTLTVTFDYVSIDMTNCPRFVSEAEIPESIRFSSLNKKLRPYTENEVYFNTLFQNRARYRKQNKRFIMSSFFRYNYSDLIEIFGDYFNRRLLHK